MDIRKYLSEQIRKCRNRMNLARCIDCGVMFAAAGGVMGMVFELSSLAWPFYYVHLAAGLCFGGGFLAGEIYAVCSRVNMAQAARRLDSFGLKERMTTAYEWMDRGAETGEELADLQRQDAFSHYNRLRDRIRIPLCPHRRHVLALLLSAAVTVGLAFVPSPARDQALLRHQIGQQAEEELEQLEELVEALEGVDQEALSEEQRAGLQELLEAMRRSGEELARADTWESLGAAQERLDYKYREAGQSLARLAGRRVSLLPRLWLRRRAGTGPGKGFRRPPPGPAVIPEGTEVPEKITRAAGNRAQERVLTAREQEKERAPAAREQKKERVPAAREQEKERVPAAREQEKEQVPAARAREKEQVPAERAAAAAATEPAGASAAATPLMTMSVFPTPRARILPSPAIKTETRIPTTSGSRTVWPGRENMWTTIP